MVENGTTRVKCPIIGCQHSASFATNSFGFSEGFRKHLRKSHSDCVDISRVKIFGSTPKHCLVFDFAQNVLVCLPTQTIILKGHFEIHQSSCRCCAMMEMTNDLRDIISNIEESIPKNNHPIQGLTQHKGISCPACNSVMKRQSWSSHKCNKHDIFPSQEIYFQQIGKRQKRAFENNPRPRKMHRISCTNENKFNFEHSPRSQVPAYVILCQISFERFTRDERKEFSDLRNPNLAEQVIDIIAEIYFLKGYKQLMTPIYLEFRQHIRNTKDFQSSNEPFAVLSDIDVMRRYAKTFMVINRLLFRNREWAMDKKATPLGEKNAGCIRMVSKFAHNQQKHLHYMKQVRDELFEAARDYKIPKLGVQTTFPHIQEDHRKGREFTLEDLNFQIVRGNYAFDDNAEVNEVLSDFHRMWCLMLTQSSTVKNPALFTTVGFQVACGRYGEPLMPAKAEYTVAAVIYCMRMVCWQHLLGQRELAAAYNLWKFGLVSFYEQCGAQLIYRLYHQIKDFANKFPEYTCSWSDLVNRNCILISGKKLHLEYVRSGLKKWIQFSHRSLQLLLFHNLFEHNTQDAIGNTKPGYTFFENENQLYDIIMSSKSNVPMKIAIQRVQENIKSPSRKVLESYCLQANSFAVQLVILMRLTVIGAPRMQEVLTWTYRNSEAMRSFGIIGQYAYFCGIYHKNRAIQDVTTQTKETKRLMFLPVTLSKMMLYYLSLVRPFTIKLNKILNPSFSAHAMKYWLCADADGIWPLYIILRQHAILTNYYFKTTIKGKEWRHIIELIFRDMPTNEVRSNLRTKLSTSLKHSSAVALKYATNAQERPDIGTDAAETDVLLAQFYHKFIDVDEVFHWYAVFYPTVENIEQESHVTHVPPKFGSNIPYQLIDKLSGAVTKRHGHWLSHEQSIIAAYASMNEFSFAVVSPGNTGKRTACLLACDMECKKTIVIGYGIVSHPNIIMLTPHNASVKKIDDMIKDKSLSRVIIMDCENLIGDSVYRLGSILKLNCNFIFISKCFPPAAEKQLFLAHGQRVPFIRKPSGATNAHYFLMEQSSRWALLFALLEISKQVSSNPEYFLLVIVPDKDFEVHISNLLPRMHRLKVTTEARNTDVPTTHLVHWRYFHSMLAFDIAISSACLSGHPVYSFTLCEDLEKSEIHHGKMTPWMAADHGAATDFMTSTECRRIARNEFMDNLKISCRSTKSHACCDYCEPTDFTKMLQLGHTKSAQYEVKIGLIENVLENEHFCLMDNKFTHLDKPCMGGKETERQFCCGIGKKSLTRAKRHLKKDCKLSHCMPEAMELITLELYNESFTPQSVLPMIQKIIRRLESSKEHIHERVPGCIYTKLEMAAINLIYSLLCKDENYF